MNFNISSTINTYLGCIADLNPLPTNNHSILKCSPPVVYAMMQLGTLEYYNIMLAMYEVAHTSVFIAFQMSTPQLS